MENTSIYFNICFIFHFYDNKCGPLFGSDWINSADGGFWWVLCLSSEPLCCLTFCFQFEGFAQISHLTQFDTITVRNSNFLRHSIERHLKQTITILQLINSKKKVFKNSLKGKSKWRENDLPGGCLQKEKKTSDFTNAQWHLKSFIQIEKKRLFCL